MTRLPRRGWKSARILFGVLGLLLGQLPAGTLLASGAHWGGISSAKAAAIQAAIESKAPEVDSDGDGKIDMWRKFTANGDLESLSYDNNGDGKPDEWVRFNREGVQRERARSFDGRIDERETQRREGIKIVFRSREVLTAGGWQLVERWEIQPGGKAAKVVQYDSAGKKISEGFESLEVR